MYAYAMYADNVMTSRKMAMRHRPAERLPLPRVQFMSHAKVNPPEAVTAAPARVIGPNCGASGLGNAASRECI